ncbi:MAG: DMT family transporter [Candidatus Woesearchaeota archaeon]|nr:MAG: DMT family transporter [Candidatus Woesearchaeota archaeon]
MFNERKGLYLVLLTAIISGVSIFANSFGVQGFDPGVFTFAKNLLVAICLGSILLALGNWKQLKDLKRNDWISLATIGLIGGSVPFVLFFAGLQMTTGTTSAFLHKSLFIFASLFAIIFLKEKLNAWFIAGAAMLLVGNYVMLAPSFALSVGHLFIVGATMLWAAENVLAKKVLKSIPGTIVAFGRMFFGSLFILSYLLFTQKASLLVALSGPQYGWIVITSLFLLGYVMTFYNGLASVKVSVATSVLALGAPLTTLLSIFFKGTALTLSSAVGMVLLAGGVFAIVWFVQLEHKLSWKERLPA